ncbi:MAG: DNA phosphorothioation-associated putative methyltransferase [Pseudomonadota bacterium]|nr:DNA phosphorothioation-associated putative methyltransferase [Pseudomonadota bacterium]
METFPIDDYREQIDSLRWGKKVFNHLYLHRSGGDRLPELIALIINEVMTLLNSKGSLFNIYKLGTRYPTVSLLSYPDLRTEAFPGLAKSAVYDLQTGKFTYRDYATNDHQPVLHRKELLLPPGDEQFSKFFMLTAAAEQAGLFASGQSIGNRGNWNRILAEHGLTVQDHQLIDGNNHVIKVNQDDPRVHRYKTALKRNRLSLPIQKLFQHHLLAENDSLMDYGCGQGDDIQILDDMGIAVNGWDPFFYVEGKKIKSDVVNLGYVLNVIDSVKERKETLKTSYALAQKLLIISARLSNQPPNLSWKRHNDGYITQRGTFQKYFEHQELANFIELSLGRKPIPVGPGIYIAFKDDDAEGIYLASKLSQRKTHYQPRVSSYSELEEEAASAANRYWDKCLELGRPCYADEIENCEALFKKVGRHTKAFDLMLKEKGKSQFNEIKIKRMNDLIVEFSLLQFQKTPFFKYLNTDQQRDIEYHFGNYSNLKTIAKQSLFSIGDVDSIHDACREAEDNGIGYLFGEHSLQLHVSQIDDLPVILRIYAGCAEKLYGSLDGIDLIKLHIHSGKVTLIGHDDFANNLIPNMIERIKINLWKQKIRFYDYVGPFIPVPLYLKSRFISENIQNFSKQQKFDASLVRTNVFDFDRETPSKELLTHKLNAAGYLIDGYHIIKK